MPTIDPSLQQAIMAEYQSAQQSPLAQANAPSDWTGGHYETYDSGPQWTADQWSQTDPWQLAFAALEQKYGRQFIEQNWDAIAQTLPGFDGNIASQALQTWQHTQDGGSDPFENTLSTLGNAALATAGFGAGGVSGASAATGNGVTPTTVGLDAAGLAAGAGLAGTGVLDAGGSTLLGGDAAGADTLAEQTLGNGLRAGATSTGIGSGELGTGLTAGAGTGATIGGGGLGTGLLTSGGVAGGALAPGYFASETAAPVIGGATSAAASGLAGQTGSGVASGAAPIPGGTSNGMWDRIANGSATASDWAMLSGGIVPGLLGYLGSSQQTDALTGLANQYMGMGAPYRDQLANLYTPEGINSYLHSAEVTTPVQQGTDALSRSLSINGNPAGSGHALQELQNYATGQFSGRLGQERDRLAGFGGLTSYNQAAPAAATGAIQSQGNEWNSIGYGVGRTLNPQPNFAQMFGFKGLV